MNRQVSNECIIGECCVYCLLTSLYCTNPGNVWDLHWQEHTLNSNDVEFRSYFHLLFNSTTSKFETIFLEQETKLSKILHRKTQNIPETSKSGRIRANSFWRKSYIDLKLTNFGEVGDFYLSNFPILGLPKKATLICFILFRSEKKYSRIS